MKSQLGIKLTLIIGFIILTMLILSSCNEPNVTSEERGDKGGVIRIDYGSSMTEYSIREFEYKKHLYIYTDVHNGISVTHAGHCKCNKNK